MATQTILQHYTIDCSIHYRSCSENAIQYTEDVIVIATQTTLQHCKITELINLRRYKRKVIHKTL